MPDDILNGLQITSRLESVLAEIRQAEEQAQVIDARHYLDRFTDLAEPLGDYFRNREWFARLVPRPAPTATHPEVPAAQPELPPGSRLGGYEILHEVGHGGRGIVYRVSDPELNRPLAVKVLRPELRGEPDAVRRFLEESQVMGQLQHPGIVPVHAVGRLPDGRPYFAMKLVQGRTLAELLAERPAPAHDLPRFLVIFQQVCQAVAYAHSRGVIHRDLKPANVMVGAFAEVQVMDWGLAKVLTGDVANPVPQRGEPGAFASEGSDAIRTVRTEAAGYSSSDGMVVGTAPYMSPEQAKGQVELLDERADVFGLGAVLCEVLTGQSPYAGVPTWKLLLVAAKCDLADAFARLDHCGADAELIALAKDCLAPEREPRPRDAGAVAERLATYLAGVQERLRRAELEKAAAQARAEEAEAKAKAERRARRLAVGLTAAAFLIALGVGGAWLWWDRRQAEERRAVTADLDQVLEFQRKGQWDDARATLERTEGRLGGGGAPDLRQRIRQGWADLEMVAWIEEARVPQIQLGVGARSRRINMSSSDEAPSLQGLLKEGLFAPEQADADYAEAFRKYGLDLQALDPTTAAERIAASSIKEHLLAALDDWTALKWTRDVSGRDHLLAIARRVDLDVWRNRFRDPAVQGNRQHLEDLAGRVDVAKQSPSTLNMLAMALLRVKARATAATMLQAAQRRYPGDFWMNHSLGVSLLPQRNRAREAETYLRAALALRPQSRHVRRNLGLALVYQGRLVEAENIFRDVLKLEPGDAPTYSSLGLMLDRQGKLEEAIDAFRQAIELKPNSMEAHGNLAMTLAKQGKLDEALAVHKKALSLDQKDARLRCNFGHTLEDLGRYAEARATFEEAIRLQPDLADAHFNLGSLLVRRLHDYDGAIASFWKCLEYDRDYADAHFGLGNAWADKGVAEKAIAAYQQAIRLEPDHAWAHCNLGIALAAKDDLAGAIFEYRTALHIQPEYPEALNALGNALKKRGNVKDAIRLHRQAINIRPQDGIFHFNLGNALQVDGALNEAIAEYRTATRLRPDFDGGWIGLAGALRKNRELEESIKVWKEVIQLFPRKAEGYTGLGNALSAKGLLDEAVYHHEKALHIDPEFALAHFNLGMALHAKGRLNEAADHWKQALRLDPKDIKAHLQLGNALRDKGRMDEAIGHYKEALRLDSKYALAHYNLGNALRDKGRTDEAIGHYKEALRIDPPGDVKPHIGLGNALSDKGLLDEAIAAYRDAVRVKQNDPLAHLNLGLTLAREGRLAESIEAYEAAARLQPDRPDTYYNLGISLLEQGRWRDAATAYRKAIAANNGYAEAHCNLGAVLQRSGQLADSLAAFRRGHELGSRDSRWRYPSAQWVDEAERLIALERQLPEIVAGKLQPANGDERQRFARLCHWKRHYEAAARLYEAALDTPPKQTNAAGNDVLYNAACSAAPAGCGLGVDAAKLDDDQRASRRRQALDWLRTSLDSWAKFLDHGKRQARATVERTLQHWQADPDLGGMRDKTGLAKLPDMEREAWEKLWADVEALRKRARETK